jgi:hypothetical protein
VLDVLLVGLAVVRLEVVVGRAQALGLEHHAAAAVLREEAVVQPHRPIYRKKEREREGKGD